MIKTYFYLNDKEFLRRFDAENHKTQYVRIYALNFKTEEPEAFLEGKSTGGSVNLSGTSNMRRTASCSLIVDPFGIDLQGYSEPVPYAKINEITNLINVGTKIFIETGFKNTLDLEYEEYGDIIWFPMGTYVIKSANAAKSTSGLNLSLTLNDKCATLNGDVGGTIPAGTILSEQEEYNLSKTKREVKKLLLKNIIRHLVVDLGGEDPARVIIEDIPDYIPKVLKWSHKNKDLFLIGSPGSYYNIGTISETDPTYPSVQNKYKYGVDVGYSYEPFTYPGKLECNAGESVATVLDKIKNTLGNFEWFYDVFGFFHFQEKKNYINTSITAQIDVNNLAYSFDLNKSKTIYVFDDNNRKLITNISNNPQYQNIKNDFVVWGTARTVTGAEKPIRYHLAFDKKPTPRKQNIDFLLCLIKKQKDNETAVEEVIYLNKGNGIDSNERWAMWTNLSDALLNKKLFYLEKILKTNGEQEFIIWHWDEDQQQFSSLSSTYLLVYLQPDDWRAELYLQGLENYNLPFDKNYYAAELNAEFLKIYTFVLGSTTVDLNGIKVPVYRSKMREDISKDNYEYFLDFIENTDFDINKIGRRTKISTDKSANCLFVNEDVPDIYLIHTGDGVEDSRAICIKERKNWLQIDEEIYNNLSTGGSKVAAYDKIKELLMQHSHYSESISLTTIPIYYLEPNNLIHIYDADLGINGDYLINTISLPLTIGTSTISCIKNTEKTF